MHPNMKSAPQKYFRNQKLHGFDDNALWAFWAFFTDFRPNFHEISPPLSKRYIRTCISALRGPFTLKIGR